MLDALILGEALVDFVPTERGRLRDVRRFEMHRGGAPANVAAGLARMGGRCALAGTVGDDEFGRFLTASLATSGVDVTDLRVVSGERTGLCFVSLDDHGERRFTPGGGRADWCLAPEDVDAERAEAARTVLFNIGSMRTQQGFAAAERLVDCARGVVCCDPGTAPGHLTDARELAARLGRLLPRCDVVKCSADELVATTGVDDPEAGAARLVERGAALAVVTMGARGAVWANPRGHGHAPAPRVEVVDTTGAGDAFMAALLLRLARSPTGPGAWPAATLAANIAFACAAGAEAVRRRGA